MSNSVNITQADIALVKQHHQKRYLMLKVIRKGSMKNLGIIRGMCTSGSISIDATSNIRRTANLTMRVVEMDVQTAANLSVMNYIKLYMGIEDNDTSEISWYKQGIYIINQNDFKFDVATRTLSLSLSDFMLDLTGDRAGVFDSFSTIVKNSQRIDKAMTSILDFCGVTNCDIAPICVYRDNYNFFEDINQEDYEVPYDLEFGTGATAYEALDKLLTLYPGWEMFFDVDGMFVCQRIVSDDSSISPVLDASDLNGLILSESINADWTKVKNSVRVWGKNGTYTGTAKDESTDSPFNVGLAGEFLMVETFDQIYDRYRDVELHTEQMLKKAELEENISSKIAEKMKLEKEKQEQTKGERETSTSSATTSTEDIDTQILMLQISKLNSEISELKTELKQLETAMRMNILVYGDDMAKEWAEELLYENCRMQDSLTLECIGLPFLNNVNVKISYRSKQNDKKYSYIVKQVTHNLDDNTTSISAIRCYGETDKSTRYLDVPEIISATTNKMEVTVVCSEVDFAEKYVLYIDNKPVATSTGTVLIYTLPATFEGLHYISVVAMATGFGSSGSQKIELEFVNFISLIDNNGDYVVTNAGERIVLNGSDENG